MVHTNYVWLYNFGQLYSESGPMILVEMLWTVGTSFSEILYHIKKFQCNGQK
jgi:hypothetical protein